MEQQQNPSSPTGTQQQSPYATLEEEQHSTDDVSIKYEEQSSTVPSNQYKFTV